VKKMAYTPIKEIPEVFEELALGFSQDTVILGMFCLILVAFFLFRNRIPLPLTLSVTVIFSYALNVQFGGIFQTIYLLSLVAVGGVVAYAILHIADQ
jgi:hypothetical protein